MSPQIQAALIAAVVTLISVAGTLVGALRATKITARETHQDTAKTLAEQRDQLDRTLEAQRDQLDRTLRGTAKS